MKTIKRFLIYYLASFIGTLFAFGFFWIVDIHITKDEYKLNYIPILIGLFVVTPFFFNYLRKK